MDTLDQSSKFSFFMKGIQMIQLYMFYPQKGFFNEPSIEGDNIGNEANHQDLKANNKQNCCKN